MTAPTILGQDLQPTSQTFASTVDITVTLGSNDGRWIRVLAIAPSSIAAAYGAGYISGAVLDPGGAAVALTLEADHDYNGGSPSYGLGVPGRVCWFRLDSIGTPSMPTGTVTLRVSLVDGDTKPIVHAEWGEGLGVAGGGGTHSNGSGTSWASAAMTATANDLVLGIGFFDCGATPGGNATVTGSGSTTVAGVLGQLAFMRGFNASKSAVNPTLTATIGNNSFTPAWFGRAWVLQGAVVAPVLTGPSGAATGNTTGSGSVGTTGADGTLWRKAATSAQTDPGAGNESANGWSSTTVAGSGTQNVTFTGLTTNTSHVANYLHVSAGGLRSSVATSATFAPPTMASSGSLSAQSGVISSAFAWTGVTPESQIIQQGVGSSAWALTSAGGSGLTTINSSTGVPGGTLTATPGTYAVTVTKTDSSTGGTNPTGGGAPPQTIVRSITVTVSAGADTTPPTLSSASATGGVATCSGSVSTNEANGTLYTVFCASATPPTAVQVEAGQDNTGAAALRAVSQAVSLSGAQTVAAGAISAGTRYAYFMHKDAAGNRSSVVASASITVTAGGVGSFNLNNAIYAFKRKDGVLLASLGATFFVNNHLTGELIGTAITGLSTNASGIVTTPVSNASVVAGTTYRLSWRFSSGEYGQIEMQAA